MRVRLLHLPAIARAVGFALVAIAMIAAALHFRAASSRIGAQLLAPAAVSDPLAAELKRCQLIAEQAKDDPGCEAAWAENRRRFFTYAPASTPAVPAKTFGR
ncbi:MAG: putative entry exclusion protein TrbK-alt [Alphaproteobacteria bacterium]|nr:putative entry exclusion protein TrbK-alt [Alphaproteobacteria bacterium]